MIKQFIVFILFQYYLRGFMNETDYIIDSTMFLEDE